MLYLSQRPYLLPQTTLSQKKKNVCAVCVCVGVLKRIGLLHSRGVSCGVFYESLVKAKIRSGEFSPPGPPKHVSAEEKYKDRA